VPRCVCSKYTIFTSLSITHACRACVDGEGWVLRLDMSLKISLPTTLMVAQSGRSSPVQSGMSSPAQAAAEAGEQPAADVAAVIERLGELTLAPAAAEAGERPAADVAAAVHG
jgi:hypothetical protein